jgi:3-oxoacyl-[acyl-carrier protein] reductase
MTMTRDSDFGLEGRTALVCGSSAGLGRACALALARHGARVTLNGRNERTLQAACEAIRAATGGAVQYAVGDVTTPEGRSAVLATCEAPDILVNNAAGPPTGDFRSFDEAAWQDGVRVSMLSPIMMIRSVLDGMIERRWGRIMNITSSAVKAPLPLLHLSNGARSGLTGFVAGLAREVARHGITINNLLPGRFETDRLRSYIAKIGQRDGVSAEAAKERMMQSNPTLRFGRPEEFGAFCAFIASDHAAYMTGQNLLIDGGEYPGVL